MFRVMIGLMVSLESTEIKILEEEDYETATKIVEVLNNNLDDGTAREREDDVDTVMKGVGENVTWLVAQVAGKVQGCLRVEIEGGRRRRRYYLSHLKVDEPFRHQGIGRKLMDTAEEMISEVSKNYHRRVIVWLKVLQLSQHVDWYRRRGFRVRRETYRTFEMRKRIRFKKPKNRKKSDMAA